MAAPAFVLPTKIPWGALKAKELEECIYWLLDCMGARDLQWRVGGAGAGAADQGRDLEATFYSSDPTGEVVRQQWWVEAKGRGSTVEKRAVMDAAHNAAAKAHVEIVLVVTNTRFTNPTIDWVRDWNDGHVRPKVRLWDCSTLERHLSANPSVVARFFSQALSPVGRLEYVRSQYWNYSQLASEGDLKAIWGNRSEISWDVQSVVAVVMSEVANGDINRRAWAAAVDGTELYAAFASALVNGPYLLNRARLMGAKFDYYTAALAYLLLGLMLRFDAEKVSHLVEASWKIFDREEWPAKVKELFIEPVLNHLEDEMFDLCLHPCRRVSAGPRLTENEIKNYRARFTVRDDPELAEEDDRRLIIEDTKLPCRIGFKECLYFGQEKETVAQRITKMHATARARLGPLVNSDIPG